MALNLDELCAKDFAMFVKHKLKKKIGKFHMEIIRRIMRTEKHMHIQAARGHWKTTIFSVYFPLWLVWRAGIGGDGKKLNIGIISHSMPRSTEIMRLVTNEIMDNPSIKAALYPDDIFHAKWSASQIITKNEHRILCCPPGGAQGEHFDLLILDDIQRDDEGQGANLENLKRIFWSVIFPVINARNGRLIVVGTPLSFDDLYSMLKTNPSFEFMMFPAVLLDEKGNWKEPVFPEHYSLAKLKEIYDSMPAWGWQSQYMLNPVGTGIGIFSYEMIEESIYTPDNDENIRKIKPFEKKDSTSNSALISENGIEDCMCYMGCDIALSPDPKSDNSCFIVVMHDYRSGMIKMVDKYVPHKGMDSDAQINEIKRMAESYKCGRIVIEQKGLGYSLAQKAWMEIPCVERFDTTRRNKEQIIGNLELLMRNRKLKIINDPVLVTELAAFGLKRKKDGTQTFEALSGHDDCVIALALACYACGGWTDNAYIPVTCEIL